MDLSSLEWAGPTAVTAATVLSTLYAGSKWVLPRVRKLGHLVDDLFGEEARPGIEPRPGLIERVESINSRLHCLEVRTQELLPNSGSTIKDAVNRIDSRLEQVERKMENQYGVS